MVFALIQLAKKIHNALLPAIWKVLFWSLAMTLAFTMLLLSRHYGITWDEWETSNNGLLALRNLLTWGRDTTLFTISQSHLYTHFFCMLVSTLYSFLFNPNWSLVLSGWENEKQILSFFQFTHLMNAAFGLIAMIYAGFFSKKIGGWRAAFLTLVLLGFSPRFIGNSMNNTKDIPFAAVYIFSIYHMSFFLEKIPKINMKDAILTAVGIGLSVGTRLGGGILVFYLLCLSALFILLTKHPQKINKEQLLRIIAALVGILLLSAFICLIFWPYGRSHSLSKIYQAFVQMSDYKHWDHPVLFEGKTTLSSNLPWYYITKWILISSPVFFPLGLLSFAFFWMDTMKFFQKKTFVILITASLFPLVFVILRSSNLYDSWRHLLFVYPPLIVFCSLGWIQLFDHFHKKIMKFAIVALLFLFLVEPAAWMARNPTYAATYFSPAVGGIRDSFPNYETDYWGNCLRESSEWLADYHKQNYRKFPLALVLVDGTVMQTYPFLKKALGQYYRPFGYPADFIKNSPYALYMFGKSPPRNLPWNYGIFISRQRTSAELKNDWPPEGTIHTSNADGVPLCAVVKNDQFYATREQIKKQ